MLSVNPQDEFAQNLPTENKSHEQKSLRLLTHPTSESGPTRILPRHPLARPTPRHYHSWTQRSSLHLRLFPKRLSPRDTCTFHPFWEVAGAMGKRYSIQDDNVSTCSSPLKPSRVCGQLYTQRGVPTKGINASHSKSHLSSPFSAFPSPILSPSPASWPSWLITFIISTFKWPLQLCRQGVTSTWCVPF